ncbi:hypothetical protein AAFF_G00102950 [Aldrovandia affinis]|uniref:Uncharacterized protein n=1 Tax=Aldrovandia affinis TaxID=143900 RepID=A0AAD7RUP6_9TELE|nr:hypothetical protein AAFF_G00102950 [Aldrovandia affinis]
MWVLREALFSSASLGAPGEVMCDLVQYGPDLSPQQCQEAQELIDQSSNVFYQLPGHMPLLHHHIRTAPGTKVNTHLYRSPEMPSELSWTRCWTLTSLSPRAVLG